MKKVSSGLLQKLLHNNSREVYENIPAMHFQTLLPPRRVPRGVGYFFFGIPKIRRSSGAKNAGDFINTTFMKFTLSQKM